MFVLSELVLEWPTIAGNSPVAENTNTPRPTLSTTGHVKPCGNPGGPPPKAKYYLTTDSEPVP
jgi:hypothetical protein